MNLNFRQLGTEIAAHDFSRQATAADHSRARQAPVIWFPLDANTPLKGGSYAKQLKMWKQDQLEEDLVFAAVGLSGIVGVVTALVTAL